MKVEVITSALSEATGILSYLRTRRRRREFQNAATRELSFLLSGLPEGWLRKVLNAYPHIWDAADSAFAREENPTEGAARIAVAVVADLIKKNLPAERRAIVLKELRIWASEPTSRKRPAKMPTDPWLSTIIILEAQSHLRVEAGRLKPLTREWMMSEIFSALAGSANVVPRLETWTRP